MSTLIAMNGGGRSYDLLDELVAYYALSSFATHVRVLGIVNTHIGVHGRDKVVISEQPVNPYESLDDPQTARWVEITDEVAQAVREHFAATIKPRSKKAAKSRRTR